MQVKDGGRVAAGSAARPLIKRGFVFKSVFGEDEGLARELIELSLGTKISKLEILQSEREFDVADEVRAGRVDVFAVDVDGNRYDVEVQAKSKGDEVLRARHYQSLMDATQLRSGTEAGELRDSVVIFVCDFDPLGADLRLYDCRMVCIQTGERILDGRRTVLLNAKGSKGDVPASLAAFLRLVDGQEVEGDDFCDRVNAIMDEKIADPKWMEDYMTLAEEIEAERMDARMEGLEEGRAEGRAEGREEMMQFAIGLVRDGILSAKDAAVRVGVDPTELLERM